MRIILLSVRWAVVVCAGVLGLAAVGLGAQEQQIYSKQSTWAQTMLASRANYLKWREGQRAERPVTLGNWYATAPLKAKSFGDALFPEKGVDLKAKDARGRALWRQHGEWIDGAEHTLPGAGTSSISTYLVRSIKAERAVKLTAGFGSDDGIEVWLNGKKIHSNNAARGVGVDSDVLTLDLAAGENQLMVKIYNQTGGYGFYFSAGRDPVVGLWQRIVNDWPVEAGSFAEMLPNNGQYAWFAVGDAKIERSIITKTLNEVGASGKGLRDELDGMVRGKVAANDGRWLELFAKSVRLRDAVANAQGVNFRALRLAIEDLSKSFPKEYTKGAQYLKQLDELEQKYVELQGKQDDASTAKLAEIREQAAGLQREALLSNPLINFDKMLVVKRSNRNLGLPQNWQGNCAVAKTGYENEIAILSPRDGKLTTLYRPEGGRFVGDVDLNFDADRMLFSMPGSNGRWQIWEIKADGTGLRQVTPGLDRDVDNYDACYRPDGKIIFASTGCFQGVPCVGGGNTVANLFVMDADGKNIRQLCFDQDHNWCPTVMNDGRILYTRWEYSDTPHYFSRLLFTMNPDGTNQMQYYHTNSYWPNSLFYARPIPNSPTKVVGIVSGHHGVPRMGEMVVLDPAKGTSEADGAVQRIPGYGKSVPAIIEDQLVNGSWPKFLHPYPLSEKYFLVACQRNARSNWGIYLVDTFDNMVLLCEMPGYAMLEPVPLRKTAKPPVIPDKVKLDQREATVYIADIYTGPGLAGVPRGTVKKLRIYEPHYAYPNMGGHINIGVDGPWDVHRIIGTVPVNEDGSASFKVPANTPLAVQPLDSEGKAVQLMRSWFSAMPGEMLSCAGCHERSGSTPMAKKTTASAYQPVEITPWYGPARGFSFKREVQPVLDKYCVGCHDGNFKDAGGVNTASNATPNYPQLLDFSAKQKNGWRNFTPSYLALHPYVRRPGPESDYHLQKPMEWHADTSRLVQLLKKGHYNVKLDAEAWDRLITWIDLNVPDHGTWGEHHPVPSNFHERRLEMRTKYANNPTDPEFIPDLKREPVAFVKPEPMQPRTLAKVDCANWPFDATEAKRRQTAAGLPANLKLDLGNGAAMELVLVPAGEFVMGDANGDGDERPLTRVKIDRPFYMGKFEVTNEQYGMFDPGHDSRVISVFNKDQSTPGEPANRPKQPVIRVSWKDASAFCAWVSEKTGKKVMLPTEAQWEYACRAGTATAMNYGDVKVDFGRLANLADQRIEALCRGDSPKWIPAAVGVNDGSMISSDVGRYAANAWGLYDMHGNVAEWTRTTYRAYPYVENDGRNSPDGSEKVVRGGSWSDRPELARSGSRLAYKPWQCVYNVGFRVIVEAPEVLTAEARK